MKYLWTLPLALGICAPLSGALGQAALADGPDAFGQILLDEHNTARTAVGTAPLIWSKRLEEEARGWAQELAAREEMAHSSTQARRGAGENLWSGTAGYYGAQEMIAAFVNERSAYRHQPFPDVSTSGNWADVGHYTQVIWRGTREVGCALANGEHNEYLVCRYWPAGNVRGQMAY